MLNKLYRILRRSKLLRLIKATALELWNLFWFIVSGIFFFFLPLFIGNLVSYLDILNYQRCEILGVSLLFNVAWVIAWVSHCIREDLKEF